jgi:hypothetical protein
MSLAIALYVLAAHDPPQDHVMSTTSDARIRKLDRRTNGRNRRGALLSQTDRLFIAPEHDRSGDWLELEVEASDAFKSLGPSGCVCGPRVGSAGSRSAVAA